MCKGIENGKPAYAYVAVPPSQRERMLADMKKGIDLKFENYQGEVIRAGEGEPTEDVKKFMKEKYEFNENYERNLQLFYDTIQKHVTGYNSFKHGAPQKAFDEFIKELKKLEKRAD